MRLFELEDLTFAKVIEKIQKDCQPFLNQTHLGLPLYRGVYSKPDVFYGKPREKRKPKDIDPAKHLFFNKMIQKKGLTANRSNSFFCTPSMSQAENYGTVYRVFPIGEVEYTWHEYASDWFETFDHAKIEDLDDFIDDLHGNDSSLRRALENHNEIMIKTPCYFVLNDRIGTDFLKKVYQTENKPVGKTSSNNRKNYSVEQQQKMLNNNPRNILKIANLDPSLHLMIAKDMPELLGFVENPTREAQEYAIEHLLPELQNLALYGIRIPQKFWDSFDDDLKERLP